jgi:divalent metal cation (Fe/Co/Zn/Cd) transporter
MSSRLPKASGVPAVQHAHARARWTGRSLRVEVEGWVDGNLSVADADRIGQAVAGRVAHELPDMRSFTWTARGT